MLSEQTAELFLSPPLLPPADNSPGGGCCPASSARRALALMCHESQDRFGPRLDVQHLLHENDLHGDDEDDCDYDDDDYTTTTIEAPWAPPYWRAERFEARPSSAAPLRRWER